VSGRQPGLGAGTARTERFVALIRCMYPAWHLYEHVLGWVGTAAVCGVATAASAQDYCSESAPLQPWQCADVSVLLTGLSSSMRLLHVAACSVF
jgi:hypothetical protein